MIHQCCSRDKVRFEIESYYNQLGEEDELEIKIKKCDVLKGTFDLKINQRRQNTF